MPWALAGTVALQRTAAPGGETLEDHPNVALFDVVRSECAAAPGEDAVMLIVAGIRHGLEEFGEAAGATDILGWRAAGACHEAGIFRVRVTLPDLLDNDAVRIRPV